jgi:hypothetical protein
MDKVEFRHGVGDGTILRIACERTKKGNTSVTYRFRCEERAPCPRVPNPRHLRIGKRPRRETGDLISADAPQGLDFCPIDRRHGSRGDVTGIGFRWLQGCGRVCGGRHRGRGFEGIGGCRVGSMSRGNSIMKVQDTVLIEYYDDNATPP